MNYSIPKKAPKWKASKSHSITNKNLPLNGAYKKQKSSVNFLEKNKKFVQQQLRSPNSTKFLVRAQNFGSIQALYATKTSKNVFSERTIIRSRKAACASAPKLPQNQVYRSKSREKLNTLALTRTKSVSLQKKSLCKSIQIPHATREVSNLSRVQNSTSNVKQQDIIVENIEIRSFGCCSVASFEMPKAKTPKPTAQTVQPSHRFMIFNTLNSSSKDTSLPVTPSKNSLLKTS